MCVLAFAWHAHPRWPMIVAGNRDELHSRPTGPLSRWAEPGHLLAGRDLQSGGTWLGVSELGRFALVTNLRGYGAPQPHRTSRGTLVTNALSGGQGINDLQHADFLEFNPFNLIVADLEQAWFLTNRPETARLRLDPGIYGLSNGPFDEPWPKTVRLKETLRSWIVAADLDPEVLLGDLREETVPDVGDRAAVPSETPLEPPLSSIFIRDPVYGTRCSTVVAMDNRGKGIIIERRFSAQGDKTGETALSFSWKRF